MEQQIWTIVGLAVVVILGVPVVTQVKYKLTRGRRKKYRPAGKF